MQRPDHKFKKRNDRDSDKNSDKFGFGSFNKKQKVGLKRVMAAVKKDAIQQFKDNGDGVCQELSMADRLGVLEAHANRAFAKKHKIVDDFIKDIDSQ